MTFHEYAKRRATEIIRGEFTTMYIFDGLAYFNDDIAMLKKSPEYEKMRDIAYHNYRLAIVIAD
jgi:hypothetical protein